MASNLNTLVTVFGGSGFVGRNVVRALCKRDYRIRVAVPSTSECAAVSSAVVAIGQPSL